MAFASNNGQSKVVAGLLGASDVDDTLAKSELVLALAVALEGLTEKSKQCDFFAKLIEINNYCRG